MVKTDIGSSKCPDFLWAGDVSYSDEACLAIGRVIAGVMVGIEHGFGNTYSDMAAQLRGYLGDLRRHVVEAVDVAELSEGRWGSVGVRLRRERRSMRRQRRRYRCSGEAILIIHHLLEGVVRTLLSCFARTVNRIREKVWEYGDLLVR